MVQMNLLAKQKRRHRHKEEMFEQQGGWRGVTNWELGLTYVYYYVYNKEPMRTYCIAQGTPLGDLGRKSKKERRYMCTS